MVTAASSYSDAKLHRQSLSSRRVRQKCPVRQRLQQDLCCAVLSLASFSTQIQPQRRPVRRKQLSYPNALACCQLWRQTLLRQAEMLLAMFRCA